ncbi:MAG: class I SAM-dependent methyltransferase, partial [Alphaproteobacteria bacterium]|nr:class I SAM-dependent methyltransferase [Alphaproteobacteria bacterium]
MSGSLARRLAARIRAEGPLPLDVFMAEALAEYYHRRDPRGASGDFTTAPE